MKILELTNYTSGGCGVGARAIYESVLLKKRGHDVVIFSSSFVKGASEIAKSHDSIKGVKILRFPAKKMGGESYMSWFKGNALEQAINFQPDVIIAHSYRHPHTLAALNLAKKIGAKCFLVTHAPFIEEAGTRSFISRLAVKFYDSKFGPARNLKKFDKVLAITNWERPYLIKLGVPESKIVYLPNGILGEFFTKKKGKEKNKIIFFGRLSPIKNLETLIKSFSLINDKKFYLHIKGPTEEDYLKKLRGMVFDLGLDNRVKFEVGQYDVVKNIPFIDSGKIFVLPSLRESMPQALLEAMARGKTVIVSDNKGSTSIVNHMKNGLTFKTKDSKDLADKINFAISNSQKNIRKESIRTARDFSWDHLIKKLESLF